MSAPVVKICGIRTVRHARVAAEAGADLVGLVFADSRRRVGVEEARAITSAAYARRPRFVGVFVNEDPDVVGRIAAEAGLDLAQLSGDEAPEVCGELRVPYTKVVHVRPGMMAADVLHIAKRYPGAAAIMLDTGGVVGAGGGPPGPGAETGGAAGSPWGGTGVPVDWALAAEVVRGLDRPVMLAGGLRPETVAGAVRAVWPWAVDVSSGVEIDGAKDEEKIRAFVAAARAAMRGEVPS